MGAYTTKREPELRGECCGKNEFKKVGGGR